MKFSKFVKAPQVKSSSSSSSGIYKKKSNLNTSSMTTNTTNMVMAAQQLLLTDDICRFQPQKNKHFLDDANKSANSTPFTNITPRINFTNLVTNINGSGSGKFLKSSQPKRLQRNRLQHVTSKPETYVLRSTLNLQNGSELQRVSFLIS